MNKIIVFTGPSGVGKATIEKKLFADEKLKLRFSVSVTTRPPRGGEFNGVQYYFTNHDDFKNRIDNNDFIEWNKHFSHYYGTLKSELNRIIDIGYNPFLEVETEGAKNIINQFNKNKILSIFIAPPSMEALKERIMQRGSETDEQITERLARVKKELKDKNLFDYVVVNNDVDKAVKDISLIIKKEIE